MRMMTKRKQKLSLCHFFICDVRFYVSTCYHVNIKYNINLINFIIIQYNILTRDSIIQRFYYTRKREKEREKYVRKIYCKIIIKNDDSFFT